MPRRLHSSALSTAWSDLPLTLSSCSCQQSLAHLTQRIRTVVLRRERGFTLIDSAVVLVILGCLMGGVLKAQELIQGARVRALIAHFGECDRLFRRS